MKFGKFEISNGVMFAIMFVIFMAIVLCTTLEEQRIRESTKQMEIQYKNCNCIKEN